MSVEEESGIVSNAAEKYAKWSIIFQITPWLVLIVLGLLKDNGVTLNVALKIPFLGLINVLLLLSLLVIGGIFSFMAFIKAKSEEPPIKKRYVILIVLSAIHAAGVFLLLFAVVVVLLQPPQI